MYEIFKEIEMNNIRLYVFKQLCQKHLLNFQQIVLGIFVYEFYNNSFVVIVKHSLKISRSLVSTNSHRIS